MLLKEAKEILKKNGYRLVEEYDAVTDRNNRKKNANDRTYGAYLNERLRRALKEEGFAASVTNFNFLTVENTAGEEFYVEYDDPDFEERHIRSHNGHANSSGKNDYWNANWSQMENNVLLHIESRDSEREDEQTFDVRNTPSMVKWIINFIEK